MAASSSSSSSLFFYSRFVVFNGLMYVSSSCSSSNIHSWSPPSFSSSLTHHPFLSPPTLHPPTPTFIRSCILLIDTRALHQPLTLLLYNPSFTLWSPPTLRAHTHTHSSSSPRPLGAVTHPQSPVLFFLICVNVGGKFISSHAGCGNGWRCADHCEQKQSDGQETFTDGWGLIFVHSQYTVNWLMHYG